jgi:nitroreductase
MILDLIKNRYSARKFTDRPIEQEKIDYIIECAYNAPSKQSMYPWTLFVLGNSPTAKAFKEWLFWEDTWCYNGERARYEDRKSNDKKFNGQYKAPLLLMWAFRNPEIKNTDDYQHMKTYQPRDLADVRDITVSASFALLAAEEQGLRTGFGGCNSWSYVDTPLGKDEVNVIISVGVGYAEEDDTVPMITPIERKLKLQGYDTKNLSQSYPIEHHCIRQLKPSKDKIVKYI